MFLFSTLWPRQQKKKSALKMHLEKVVIVTSWDDLLNTSDIWAFIRINQVCMDHLSIHSHVSDWVGGVAVCSWLYKHEGRFDVFMLIDMKAISLGCERSLAPKWPVTCVSLATLILVFSPEGMKAQEQCTVMRLNCKFFLLLFFIPLSTF